MRPRPLVVPLLGLAMACLLACSGSRGLRAGWQGEGRSWFDAEWIQGYSSDGSPVATLSVSVPRRNLVFFTDDEGYQSHYRIRCVQRAGGRPLRSQEWGGSVSVASYAETRSETQEQKTVQFALDPSAAEDLQLVVSLSVDGTQRQATRVLSADRVRRAQSGLGLGELRLYATRAGSVASDASIPLGPGALPDAQRFVPAGTTSFDAATGAPWLLVRVFDLRGEEAGDYPLVLSVVPGRGEARIEMELPRQGVESGLLFRLDPALFAFGENKIEVQLAGELSSSVTMQNLGVDLEDDDSWKASLRHLEGLATDAALSRLSAVPSGARREAWMEFWSGLDATPDDGVNQRLREHYRRVQYARRALRDGSLDGALSDRGHIYVLHGEPSRIEDIPPRWDDPTAWQIWTYESLGLVYYFRQAQGGSYRLAGSERA